MALKLDILLEYGEAMASLGVWSGAIIIVIFMHSTSISPANTLGFFVYYGGLILGVMIL